MKLSVCMIVKNEESCLATCLNSVKGADEIIIVDTGSVDKTVEIAKKFTDKVYEDFKWCDSFCKARNHALSKCSGDWILNIDADEVLEENGIAKIREAISKTNKEALYIKLKSFTTTDIHNFTRVFKRVPHIFWKGDIHNYLSTSDGDYTNIIINYGYSEAHKKDPDRALRILTKTVAENPKLIRERYYLAREFFYRKNHEMAIIQYDHYLKVAHWSPEMADAHLMKARCYHALQQYENARNSCLEAIKINTNFKEALLLMADLSGPINKERWKLFADSADNSNVLFIRNKTEKGSDYYDNLFKHNHDFSRYEEIHKKIAEIVGDASVLDIGCGPATLSNFIPNYNGFDFSEEAIKKANHEKVWKGNAYEKDNYIQADYYIATEVFEHLDDLKVIDNIPSGARIIFSVPSFDDPSHIRTFTEDIVKSRYKNLIINNITRFDWHGKWTIGPHVENYILLVEAVKR